MSIIFKIYPDKSGQLAQCIPIYGTILCHSTRNRANAGQFFLVCRDIDKICNTIHMILYLLCFSHLTHNFQNNETMCQSWVIGIFFGIRYRYIPIPKMFRYFGICTDTEYRITTISVFFPVFMKNIKKIPIKRLYTLSSP